MKKIVLMVCFIFYFITVNAQFIETLFEQGKVNGKVKAILEIQITSKINGTRPDSLIFDAMYDNKGNTVKETFTQIYNYAPNTVLIDQNGNITHPKRREIAGISKYATKYLADGRKITTNKDEGLEDVYLFNKRGIIIRYDKYQLKEKELVSRARYKYDDKNCIIEYDEYDNKDSLYEQSFYEYDNKNMLIEEKIYDPIGQIYSKFNYTYLNFDKEGNWIKRLKTTMNSKDSVIQKDNIQRKITYY